MKSAIFVSNRHLRHRLQRVDSHRNLDASPCLLSGDPCCCVAAAPSHCILTDVDRGHMGPSAQSGAHSLQLIQALNV